MQKKHKSLPRLLHDVYKKELGPRGRIDVNIHKDLPRWVLFLNRSLRTTVHHLQVMSAEDQDSGLDLKFKI